MLFQAEIVAIETAGHQAARAGNGDLLQLRRRVDDVDTIAATNVRIAPDAQGIAAHFAMDARLQIAVCFDHERCCRPDAHVDLDIDALHAVDVERADVADLAHVAAHLLVALDGIATRVDMAHFAIVGVDDDGATAKGKGTAQGQQGTHGVSFMIVLIWDRKKPAAAPRLPCCRWQGSKSDTLTEWKCDELRKMGAETHSASPGAAGPTSARSVQCLCSVCRAVPRA
ncbi:hypothetical protein D3C72_1276990 [compost metagenome]